MMATKKTSDVSQTQGDEQTGADTQANLAAVSTDATANIAVVSDPAAEAPPPEIPEPIFATDDTGRDRPMSGGSFIRQSDGTLRRAMPERIGRPDLALT